MSHTEKFSIKTVRRNCIECSGGSSKYVCWCPCDGIHSTRCEFWPFRFGILPDTFRARHGDRLLDPESMPPATVDLDSLPNMPTAATAAIDVDGYHMDAVDIQKSTPRRKLSDRQLQALRHGRQNASQANKTCC